jgi:hypothetical protein
MPELVRRNHGRGHSYTLDGEKVLSVTQILGASMAKPALTTWAAKAAAEYAVDHWDELLELGPSNRLQLISAAPWRETQAKAARGTLIHDLASRLVAGQEVDVTDEVRGHVDSYLKFCDDWQLQELLVEVPVGAGGARNRAYAGTLDLVAVLSQTFDDAETWILDIKTGKGVYPEVALQLAAYRYAEFYADEQGQPQPLPHIDRAGVVHLHDHGYDLYPVEAGRAEFLTFQYAQQVALFTLDEKEREVQHIGSPLTPPTRSDA